ncbi:N-acetyltransferase family protein [Methanoregula sp.]|uniref:GNAT family N-acetyltransferase n=1 Tax=Methanoregula sp. TaxID=2052170 RepID=UPI003565E738
MLRENRSPEIPSAGNNPGTPVISFLSEADAGPVTQLYADIFLADEPTSVRIAPDPARLLPLAHWYVGLLARRGFSFVARAPHTGEPVGFLFSFDITDDFCEDPMRYAAYLDNFREAIAMIDELEERFLDRRSIPPGAVLHALQGGVSRDYRRCGLLKAMMERLVTRARERGYRQIVAECTNPASHKALLASGFCQAGFLAYDTFQINGAPCFAGLSGGLSLMVLDL